MISEWNDGEPAAIFETGSKLDFGQFWHCGRAHFASAARHGAEFLYGPGRGRDRQEIRRPLFFGTFRAGATPKLAKVELSRSGRIPLVSEPTRMTHLGHAATHS